MQKIIDAVFDIDKRTRAFPKLILFLCVLSIVALFFFISLENKKIIEQEKQKKVPFVVASIQAKAAFVWDMAGQKMIYGKNENLPLPLASITKVMTVITAEKTAGGMDKVEINLNKIKSEWKIKDLIDYLLVVSSNDGATALASAAEAWSHQNFINEMNQTAKQIGLANTTFFNEHGLDRGEDQSGPPDSQSLRAGAYGSAKDVGLMFEYALKNYPHVLEATKYPEIKVRDLSNDIYNATNTNLVIDKIPSLIASKTGLTDLAGGNLAIVFDAGIERPIVITVLGSTENGRFTDVIQLVQATMRYISQNP